MGAHPSHKAMLPSSTPKHKDFMMWSFLKMFYLVTDRKLEHHVIPALF